MTGAKYQVMPDLTPLEYEALKADIAAHGILVPVELDEDGQILDGHHRLRAWSELYGEGHDLPDYPLLVRSGMTEQEKRSHAYRINLLHRTLTKEQRAETMRAMRAEGATYQEIATATGVDTTTAWRATSQIAIANSEIENSRGQARPAAYAPRGEKEILEAAKQIRQERAEVRRGERIEKIAEISRGNVPLAVTQRFPVIYADPPWRYEHSQSISREIENQYPTMSLDEICALPVQDVITPDAILFLWTTSPKLEESMRVIDAWGFTYRTCFVWVKDKIGMGYYARQRHELLLVAKRGDIPTPPPSARYDSVIEAPRGEHSEKPLEVYEMIETMYPDLPRIEFFARTQRAGWEFWGNQVYA